MADKKEKQKKPSFSERMAERVRDAKHLGKTLKDEPQAFPREVGGIVRRTLRRVWDARGGGLYACGFVVTFIYLETRMLVSDIVEADSVGGFFTEQAMEMVFRYAGESIQNTVQAFLWPVRIIQLDPVLGVAVLAAGFIFFDRVLKARIEAWLMGKDDKQDNAQ